MLSKTRAKYITSLQHKKFRDAEQVFAAEGLKLVNELMAKKIPCSLLVIDEERFKTEDLINLQADEIVWTKGFELQKISTLTQSPGVVGIFKYFKNIDPAKENGLVLCLDRIQDPGNLGTIIRSAAWFGIQHIVCNHGTADMYNPKVVQGTMGAICSVNIFYTDLFSWLKNYQHTVLLTALKGKELNKINNAKNAAIIIGNEANGVDPIILDSFPEHITIPGRGEGESLNAAMAASIIMYALTTGSGSIE